MAGPMIIQALGDLVRQTLFDPREAAGRLIALELPRNALWMALGLMTVLNTIVYSLSLTLAPPGDPAAMAMVPPIFQSPLFFALFLGGTLVIVVLALTWIGQTFGGRGRLDDILVLITWLQVLRLGLQALLTLILVVAPLLGGLITIVASVWGIYILVAFIDRAHGFDNMFRAAGVLLVGALAMVFGLSLILGVIGAGAI